MNKKLRSIILRYLFLLIFCLFAIDLIYFIFTPLTIYPVFFILSLFYKTILNQNIITIGETSIQIIGPCVAGFAYLFLLILNLSTPMQSKKRIYSLTYSFAILLLLNILRIILLSFLIINFPMLFDITHKLFWYGLSTLFVVLIWFSEVKFFNIKQIPFYSDIKYLITLTR